MVSKIINIPPKHNVEINVNGKLIIPTLYIMRLRFLKLLEFRNPLHAQGINIQDLNLSEKMSLNVAEIDVNEYFSNIEKGEPYEACRLYDLSTKTFKKYMVEPQLHDGKVLLLNNRDIIFRNEVKNSISYHLPFPVTFRTKRYNKGNLSSSEFEMGIFEHNWFMENNFMKKTLFKSNISASDQSIVKIDI